MSIDLLLSFCAPAIAFERAAGRRLQACFPDRSAEVWRSTRTWQSRLAPNRPRHSVGVNLMMRYMEWSCALYRAVQEHGMPQADAADLVETIIWEVYRPVTATLFKLSRLRSAQRETRVQWLLAMMIRYFFTSPFQHQVVPSDAVVAFDVRLCPLANYFEDQGVLELTRHAACNLDYRMASEWGVELARSQTIAAGAPHCDFRFRLPSTSDGSFREPAA